MFLRLQGLGPWGEIKSLMPLSTKNWRIRAIFDRFRRLFAKSTVLNGGQGISVLSFPRMDKFGLQIRRKAGITFPMQAIWRLSRNFYAQASPLFAPKRDGGARDLPQNPIGVGGTGESSAGQIREMTISPVIK